MILNLTQHPASPEQIEAGVIEPQDKAQVKNLLTFHSIPVVEDILDRARALAEIAEEENCEAAMIGGAPYLMSLLESELEQRGIKPLYSFTERKSVEIQNPDGSVTKNAVFQHVGWVEV